MRLHFLGSATVRAVVCGVVFSASSSVWPDDVPWPGFRGKDAAGVAVGVKLPTHWSDSENVAWKVDVPGIAWSCPVVAGDRIFLTTAIPEGEQEPPKKGLYFGGERKAKPIAYRWEILCLDKTTGKKLWSDVARTGIPKRPIHIKNSYASETPITDGKHVWAFFGQSGLFCYTVDGKRLWEKQLGAFVMRFGWGTASSPAFDGKRIFVQYDNEEKDEKTKQPLSFLAAFDAVTGNEIWRQQREEVSSWATPFVWKTPQRTELVTAASRKVRSNDPETGKLLWELGGMSSIAVPTPIAGPDLLYVCSGYVMDTRRPIFAIRPNASGDITLKKDETSSASIAWFQKQSGPYMPTPVLYDGLLYVLYDRGLISCFDAKTGEVVYEKQRLSGSANAFTSCPWAYDGKVFCLSEEGDTFVVRAGKKFEVLGKNSVGEFSMATPAIADNALFLRTLKHLYRIENRTGVASTAHATR